LGNSLEGHKPYSRLLVEELWYASPEFPGTPLTKKRGWRLAASGDGLFDETGRRIASDTERSIYEALEMPWQEPWERR